MVEQSTHISPNHLPIQFVPKSFWEQNCRIVSVARNGKDSVVSFFHFQRMTMIHPEPGDWNSYLQRFMEGKMVFGSWYDHVNSWWEKKQTYPNLHMLFEDLVEMDFPPRPELFDFHGVPMTHYFTDNWENVQNFQARPDDILLATYPKAGTTWVSYILDLLYFDQTSSECRKSLPIYVRVPILEVVFPSLEPGSSTIHTGTDMVNSQLTSPRLIRTHLPIQFVPKSFWEQNCRIVYVARNGKDSVVSFFHFQRMTMIHPEPGDWNSYLQRFIEGKMVFGSWYDHVNSWWQKKQTYPNLHYMFFEDLVEDPGRELDKLCCFLGLSPSVEKKERLLETVLFENMKKDKVVNHSTSPVMNFKVSSFIRKGKVGDWKNHFTVAQSEEFDEDYKKKMKNPTLKFRT